MFDVEEVWFLQQIVIYEYILRDNRTDMEKLVKHNIENQRIITKQVTELL